MYHYCGVRVYIMDEVGCMCAWRAVFGVIGALACHHCLHLAPAVEIGGDSVRIAWPCRAGICNQMTSVLGICI